MAVSNYFEYKIRQLEYSGSQKQLRHDEVILEAHGEDGWELVSAFPVMEEGKTVRIVYCLKKHTRRSII